MPSPMAIASIPMLDADRSPSDNTAEVLRLPLPLGGAALEGGRDPSPPDGGGDVLGTSKGIGMVGKVSGDCGPAGFSVVLGESARTAGVATGGGACWARPMTGHDMATKITSQARAGWLIYIASGLSQGPPPARGSNSVT